MHLTSFLSFMKDGCHASFVIVKQQSMSEQSILEATCRQRQMVYQSGAHALPSSEEQH